jgi:predicted transposase YdaD
LHDYDKCSKWLLQHHADSILRLAGVRDIASWKAIQAELVMARRLPDGLIEVHHQGERKPDPYIVEVATYPDARLAEQILDDTAAFRLVRRALPEVVVLFLHPKGQIEAAGSAELRSRRGFTSWNVGWRAIRLWEVPAADLLAAGDIGLIPWVPLAKIEGPPEPVFRECRDRIRREAPENEQGPMLVITHFLAGLKYDDRRVFELLGGRQVMRESKSPIVQELRAEWMREANQDMIVELLVDRFGPEARELRTDLEGIEDATRLKELTKLAFTCPDLDAFRSQISS